MKVRHLARNIDWSSFTQPTWNKTGALESALDALRQPNDPEGVDGLYNRLLYALGSNHAGTLYPIAVPAIPVLAEIARDGPHRPARRFALEVLVDVASFGPDQDFGPLDFGEGTRAPLEKWVSRRCAEAATTIRDVVDEWRDEALIRSAHEFLRSVEGVPR
ncbi:MAG: hypothetical protein AAGF12_25365 [Myxococcota bacterium]